MQRHLSTGATIIAGLLATDQPSTEADGTDHGPRAPGPDVRSLLADLGWDAHRSVGRQARIRDRDPQGVATV